MGRTARGQRSTRSAATARPALTPCWLRMAVLGKTGGSKTFTSPRRERGETASRAHASGEAKRLSGLRQFPADNAERAGGPAHAHGLAWAGYTIDSDSAAR